MARLPQLMEFSATHALDIDDRQDLIRYRRRNERLVTRAATTALPTRFGVFQAHAYECSLDTRPYVALTMGEIGPEDDVLVRVHSGCLTGDVFHSLRCDCGHQLELALQRIQNEGKGILLYLEQEGRGIGLINKLESVRAAGPRSGHRGGQRASGLPGPAGLRDRLPILFDLGARKLRLMTNNPKKYAAMEGYGLTVVEQVPLVAGVGEENRRYLEAKRDKMGHLLPSTLGLDRSAGPS